MKSKKESMSEYITRKANQERVKALRDVAKAAMRKIRADGYTEDEAMAIISVGLERQDVTQEMYALHSVWIAEVYEEPEE